MVIQHNLASMNSNRMLGITTKNQAKSSEKLSSGYKINRAADNAAGLSISEKMRQQIRGLNRGSLNAQDGISLVQVADGALSEVNDMIQRLTELTVQAANGTLSPSDRAAIQQEITQISTEVDRIGDTTTFNNIPIFKDLDPEAHGTSKSITSLLASPAAEKQYMIESFEYNGKYYPSGTIDFSKITPANINCLIDGGFTFNCTLGCSEVFDFKFSSGVDSASNLVGKVHHKYVVDISDCVDGKDVVNKIFEAVKKNPPTGNDTTGTPLVPGALNVSHTNEMVRSADGTSVIIYSNQFPCATAAMAENKFSGLSGVAGGITCTQIVNTQQDDFVNPFKIQCSSNVPDELTIKTRHMNASVLGVDQIDVTSENLATRAIKIVDGALDIVTRHRSELGAYQNRLEHTIANIDNIAENTTAAESRIRDTDMAEEMVNYSKNNILAQAGQSMLAQANSSKDSVLSLLQ